MIKGAAYYHPAKAVGNEYYIEYYKKQGKDIEGLLKATGRKNRYVSESEEENVLTMGYQASVEVLQKTYVKPSQINLIVFSSGTPEYIAPTNAMKLHDMLHAGQKCAVYDLNANCAGMVVALEQVSRIMRSNKNIKYALIVGSDQLSRYARYDEEIAYANFADSACAILVENIFDTYRGFIDSDFYTNSSNHNKILMPAKGMSHVAMDKNLPTKDKLVTYGQFDFGGAFHSAKVSIEELLFRNNIRKKDIKKYFFSQFSWKYLEKVSEDMDEDISKFKFVGDEFGYTGTTSPMLAYAKALEAEELDIGDYVVFWTVGAGTTCPTVLYKY
ncbi:MAG: 3-oxoacyl-ACP synthase III family protein [Lachnospiraceae bacterium]|nr:3-oxoacyl-ACP synthase III family protein [Lachnospiraceae bacterium]MBO5146915.1 3-oxoacyl-ACP synthase III family protein [Lachnospiraceae bacterium]